jgi:transposase
MLSKGQRTAILELAAQGVSQRQIARVMKISRRTVRRVIGSKSPEAPAPPRPEKAEAYRQEILDLLTKCKGNLVRVHEELLSSGAGFSYQALTAFCRRHGIGQKPLVPAGRYHFEAGEEIQHDTSPHQVEIAGKNRLAQTASAVLCYSRMMFFQCYPSFQRFDCKVFLTEAGRYFGGFGKRVMIDNTHVVVLRGTGREMIPVPEMAAFAERFGFAFIAHERGDANRSGRVERPFWFIETNFLATGCRLKVSDFSTDEQTIRLHEKGDKRRTIGIHIAAVDAVREYITQAGITAGPLFRPRLNPRSQRLANRGMSERTMYRLIMSYLERLAGAMHDVELEDKTVVRSCIYTPHSLRATTATLLLDASVDIRKVQDLLGHRHITTIQIYDKRRISTSESASHDVPI